jgi:hypothetical protein
MSSATASIVNLVASILAAAATIVLAVFSIRQWHVMKENNDAAERQNELVRERWKREDELRAEENRPKAEFWLQRTSKDQVELLCANVGTVNFLVTKMTIGFLQDAQFLDIPIDGQSRALVLAGTEWKVDLESRKFGFLICNGEVKLSLRAPSGLSETNVQNYYFYFADEMCHNLIPGFHESERIECPKCKNLVANFRVAGVTSGAECRKKIASLKEECAATCPNHECSNGRLLNSTEVVL